MTQQEQATRQVQMLVILQQPQLLGRLTVTLRPDAEFLFRADRHGADSYPRMCKLIVAAQALRHPDLDGVLSRAAAAALRVVQGDTNAQALQETPVLRTGGETN